MTNDSFDSVIAVLEPRPYWAPELNRRFGHRPIAIRECRSIDELRPAIQGFHSALFVIDLGDTLLDCLKWLRVEMRNPIDRYPTIVCGSAATVEYEWLLRETGVTAFLPDVIPGDDFARLCLRQLGSGRK